MGLGGSYRPTVLPALLLIGCFGNQGEALDDGHAGADSVEPDGGMAGSVAKPGAGSGLTLPFEPAAGARLRPILIGAADAPAGAPAHAGWRDESLGTRCSVELAADGVLRCLPEGPLRDGDMTYLDAGCRSPAYRSSTAGCEEVPTHVREQLDFEACTRRPRLSVFEATPLSPAPAELFRLDDTGCVPAVPPREGEQLLALEQRPASEFVALEPEQEQTDARLAQRRFIGADGSRGLIGLRDSQLGDLCEVGPLPFEDGHACYPLRTAHYGRFYPNGCDGDALADYALDPSRCGPPVFATSIVCESRTGFWSIGDEYAGAEPLSRYVAVEECDYLCEEGGEVPEGLTLYALGDEIADPVARLEPGAVGDAGFNPLYLGADGRALVPLPDEVAFTTDEGRCDARTMSDGSLRCLPDTATRVQRGGFADAECSEPLFVGQPGARMFYQAEDNSCGRVISDLYRVRGRYEGDTYYEQRPEGCRMFRLEREGGDVFLADAADFDVLPELRER